MRLFDERNTRHRTKGHSATRSNSGLRETLGQNRIDLYEEWFSRYPADAAAEFLGRIDSESAQSWRSAIFELVIHEMLLRLNFAVTVHAMSDRPGVRSPDFLVDSQCQPSTKFFLEVVTVTNQPSEREAADAGKRQLRQELNHNLPPGNFHLIAHESGSFVNQPSARKLAKDISAWLAKLDPDKVEETSGRTNLSDRPTFDFAWEGYKVSYAAIAKPKHLRGQLGSDTIMASTAGWARGTIPQAIARALSAKARAYELHGVPLLIAMAPTFPGATQEHVREALYGAPSLVFDVADESLDWASHSRQEVLKPSWFGSPEQRSGRVFAVLGCILRGGWSPESFDFVLYRNPWAKQPLLTRLNELPQVVVLANRLTQLPGIDIASLLGFQRSASD